MSGRLQEAWRWWIDGLVDAVLLVEARVRRDRPVRLVGVDGGWVIAHAGGRLGRRRLVAGPRGLAPARLAEAIAGRSIEVVIRPEEVVTRRLGPLPPESRPYVEGIVTHQLERMTPWLAADTLTSHRIETVGPDDPRLMVTVDATSRALQAEIVVAMARLAPKELHLVRPATEASPEVALPIAAADHAAKRRRLSTGVTIGLAALALIAVATGWWIVSATAAIDAQVAETEERIDAYRRRLAPTAGAAASDRDIVAALSRDTPMAVIALENLSAVLPDDTHLTSLQIGRGRLRMIGITRDITALTRAVEAAPAFSEPSFSAPTVRLSQGDRFTLDLTVAGTVGGRR